MDRSASHTRERLTRIATDPDAVWAALVEKSASKLRVLIGFEVSKGQLPPCDIEDILQEVWMQATRSVANFEYRGPGSLHRWLAGITRNKVLHARRSVVRRESHYATACTDSLVSEGGLQGALNRSCLGASASAKKQEMQAAVHSVLASLSEDLRTVILLRIYEGLSGKETALRLGAHESTVSLRFRKALQVCADRLKGQRV